MVLFELVEPALCRSHFNLGRLTIKMVKQTPTNLAKRRGLLFYEIRGYDQNSDQNSLQSNPFTNQFMGSSFRLRRNFTIFLNSTVFLKKDFIQETKVPSRVVERSFAFRVNTQLSSMLKSDQNSYSKFCLKSQIQVDSDL